MKFLVKFEEFFLMIVLKLTYRLNYNKTFFYSRIYRNIMLCSILISIKYNEIMVSLRFFITRCSSNGNEHCTERTF